MEKILLSLLLFNNDVEKMTQDLDPSKVHGQDMTRIRMLKIYGESIFQYYIENV